MVGHGGRLHRHPFEHILWLLQEALDAGVAVNPVTQWHRLLLFSVQYHFSLSTTLSSGSLLAKRRQFSSRISSHFWRYGAPEIATWGVISTFGMPHSGLSGGSGSGATTSSPAPASWPDRRATIRSAVTTQPPREILIKYAPRFIREKSRASNIPSVSGVSGVVTITK